MTDALIREVDSAVKADRWRALWQQFGKTVFWTTGTILVLTVGYVWFDTMRTDYQQNVTAGLVNAQQALAAEDASKAKRILEATTQESAPIGSSESSLRTLALLQLAALPAFEQEELDATFGDITAHPNTDIALQQLWHLLQLRNAAQGEGVNDTLLTAPKDGPFSTLIREQQAVLLSHTGNTGKAHNLLSELANDASLTSTQRQRIDMLLGQFPSDATAEAANAK